MNNQKPVGYMLMTLTLIGLLFSVQSVKASTGYSVEMNHDIELEMHEQVKGNMHKKVTKEKPKKSKFEEGLKLREEIKLAVEANNYDLLSPENKAILSLRKFNEKVGQYTIHQTQEKKINAIKNGAKIQQAAVSQMVENQVYIAKKIEKTAVPIIISQNKVELKEHKGELQVEKKSVKQERKYFKDAQRKIVKNAVNNLDDEKLGKVLHRVDTTLRVVTQASVIDMLEGIKEVIIEALEG